MGKMKRGNKAKKIKDPYAIQRERDRGKNINQKPSDLEDQFVPRKVSDLMRLSDGARGGFTHRRKAPRKQTKDGRITSRGFVESTVPVTGMTKPLKPIPLFEQLPFESDTKFLKRVEKLTKARLQQSRFEDKYKVDIVPDPATGGTKMISRQDDAPAGRRKKKKKTEVDEDGNEVTKKPNRKKLAQLKRKQKLADKQDDFAHLNDRVQFGDVVQRPPDIRQAPRKASTEQAARKPGRKALLLKQLYTEVQAGGRASCSQAPKSLHRRDALEQERLKAVAAYRALRQQRIERNGKPL